ncbi:MAG: type II toxin-antitoxin system RelE/ParE family toxin [Bacteroidetes bacterium]|jgi:toxin ParE1/3/4|nr:type II toxin-antitoxin system RelE/ParE family toxin [Bacteroidota bacterium]MBL0095335.1 type II toxin-antitoxin system RelE/ParE family toxin [Bacteroidota bacterium]
MARVIWTKLALNDIDRIHDFIAKDSPLYARKTVEQIFRRVDILENFPMSGREIPEYLRKDIRELLEGNYRIFYRVKKSGITVLRIHHSAQKIPK